MKNTLRGIFCSIFFVLFSVSLFSQTSVNASLSPDSIAARFIRQLNTFPQEKIYAHIDKPFYIGGEDIFFRAHLSNALSHVPDSTSKYIYVELISPLDSVMYRGKVRHQSGAYCGQVSLQEDMPEGNYQLRFYTKFMQNLGENYFFKRNITIGDPLSALYRTEAKFEQDGDKNNVKAELRFIDVETGKIIKPEKIEILADKGVLSLHKIDKDSVVRFSFKSSEKKEIKSIYIEYDYLSKFHKQFIPVSLDNDDFDVSFFPEGGHMTAGVLNRIGFKALNAKGLGENFTAVMVNEKGDSISSFSSQHLGMGSILYMPTEGDIFYAVCKNEKGKEKRVKLPVGEPNKIALQTTWQKKRLFVSIRKSAGMTVPDDLHLIVHSRGILAYAEKWNSKQDYIIINNDVLPTGVVQILLVDANSNPVSERLVFNVNKSFSSKLELSTDKASFKNREKIKTTISLSDEEQTPLAANLSMSVTDSKDILPDTCVNILSTLLLTSELKGYIESPAYYFENNNPLAEKDLDNLLMTQGWTRYNVPQILKGEIVKPSIYLETAMQVSGTVKGGLLMNKPSAGYTVSLFVTDPFLYGEVKTDENGRFSFNNFELPDSIRYIIQSKTKKGGNRVELLVDKEVFPSLSKHLPANYEGNRSLFENYIGKADQRYVTENGMRMIYLKDIEVTAQAKERKNRSPLSSSMNPFISAEEIEKKRFRDMFQLLSSMAGVVVSGDNISIRGGRETPLILIDGMEMDKETLQFMSIEDVGEVELVKDGGAAIFGVKGGNGVIMVTTKKGEINYRGIDPFNVKAIKPLGIQTFKEFYSPKYETPEQINSSTPDLRTTIYWNPSVVVENGKAETSFYAADAPTTYSVIIEGITSDGRVVYAREEIKRED